MNGSTLYSDFNGYNSYPQGIGEEMIRGRLSELFGKLIEKNDSCLTKSREMGMEKIMSRVLQIKTRMERMKHEMEHRIIGGEYKLEKMPDEDVSELHDVDLSLENHMNRIYEIMNSLTCMETEMHISDRFAQVSNHLREIEGLCHKRVDIFKRSRVFG